MRRMVGALLAAALASGTVGCTTGGKEPGSGQGEPGGTGESKVEIRFGWWGGQARHDKHNKIVDEFEKAYPQIKVVREFGSWDDYWDKQATQTAGGDPIDVMSMHQRMVSDYAKRGALLNLNDMVDQGAINLKEFPQAVIDSGKIDGSIYMVSQGNTIMSVAYNKAIFDQLGVAYPNMDWTWDEFIAKAEEIQRVWNAKDKWALGDAGNAVGNFTYYVRQKGKDFYTKDGKLGFDKTEAVEWFAMWDRLRRTGVIPDAETVVEYGSKNQEDSLFGNNRIAFQITPANQVKIFDRYADGELHMVRVPSIPGGQNGELIEGAYLSISAKSKHPKEAALLIDYWLNAEKAAEIFLNEQGPVGSVKINEFVKPFLTPEARREIDFTISASKLATPVNFPPVSGAGIESAFKLAGESIAFKKKTIEKAVDDFFAEADKMLK